MWLNGGMCVCETGSFHLTYAIVCVCGCERSEGHAEVGHVDKLTLTADSGLASKYLKANTRWLENRFKFYCDLFNFLLRYVFNLSDESHQVPRFRITWLFRMRSHPIFIFSSIFESSLNLIWKMSDSMQLILLTLSKVNQIWATFEQKK